LVKKIRKGKEITPLLLPFFHKFKDKVEILSLNEAEISALLENDWTVLVVSQYFT